MRQNYGRPPANWKTACMRCGQKVDRLDARLFGRRTLCWRCYRVELAAWVAETEPSTEEKPMEKLNLPNRGAKLDDQKVREIRRRRAAGESLEELATDFRVSRVMISRIVRRVSWAHVK